IWQLRVFANDSEIMKIWRRPRQDIRIELDLLCPRIRDLDWLAEFRRCDVDLCASGEILREIRRGIATGILRRRTHLPLDGAGPSQLITEVTQIIARQLTLTIS